MYFKTARELAYYLNKNSPRAGGLHPYSESDLNGANLSGANLSEADLHEADLSLANLRGADLKGANLSGVNLFSANLSGADLNEANLNKAYLNDANLSGADLRRANLRGANLSEANLSGADLKGAILSGADLSRADLTMMANLRGANLSEANLSGADLKGANLSEADLSGADLSGADLGLARLFGTRFIPNNLLLCPNNEISTPINRLSKIADNEKVQIAISEQLDELIANIPHASVIDPDAIMILKKYAGVFSAGMFELFRDPGKEKTQTQFNKLIKQCREALDNKHNQREANLRNNENSPSHTEKKHTQPPLNLTRNIYGLSYYEDDQNKNSEPDEKVGYSL